jgi:hypothetical protein
LDFIKRDKGNNPQISFDRDKRVLERIGMNFQYQLVKITPGVPGWF